MLSRFLLLNTLVFRTCHFLGLLLTLSANLQAQTIRYVKAGGTGSGSSWTNASGNLQAMINASNTNDQVWVAQGSYSPTTGSDRFISFSMKNGVSIYGGFVGNETNLAARPTINPITGNPSSTTLSGKIDRILSVHVILNPPGIMTTAVLDGFVVTAGFALSFRIDTTFNGGGMYNDHASPTLRNCSFVDNYSGNAGGAMYNDGKNSRTSGLSSSPVLINCLFQNNGATYGGAISNDGRTGTASPVLTNCSFVTNNSGNGGGAIYNDGSTSGRASPQLTNCSFQANEAVRGGVMLNNGFLGTSSPTLTNCSFLANSASEFGGAMLNYGAGAPGESNPVLTNCSFQSNSAPQGGVMRNEGESGGTASPVLTNCVLFSNGGSNTFSNSNASISSATYCLFDDTNGVNVSGPGNLTTTTSPFTNTSSVTLNACSPAIDAGTNAVTTPATDLAGNDRRVRTIDMGAYEFQDASARLAITQQPPSARSVCAGATVTASVGVSGVSPTFQWYKDNSPLATQTSATLSLPNTTTASAGSYYVVVTGACNSLTATAFNLTVNAPQVSINSSTTAICQGRPATLTASGAASYQWRGPQSFTSSANPITTSSTGTYSVTGRTSQGCLASATLTLTSTSLVLGGSATDVSCFGRFDGQATVTVTGGSGDYFYAWSPSGGTRPTAQGLSPGQYTVIVTDNNLFCLAERSFVIGQPPALTSTLSLTNVSTFGGQDGAASLAVSGGTVPYSYNWEPTTPPGEGTSAVSGLAAGDYSVLVTDNRQCTLTRSFSIGQPSVPLTISAFRASSASVCAGTALVFTATLDNVGATYSYTLTVGDRRLSGTSNQQPFSQPLTAAGLGDQTASLSVSTANGQASATTVVRVNALPTVSISPSVSLIQGQSVTLTASGADTFTWSTGETTASIVAMPSSTTAYSVTGTTGGCSATASQTITVKELVCGPVLYVTLTGSGSQDGSSWANAIAGANLQLAIDRGASCGGNRQVWVSHGTYKPTTNTVDRDASFQMKNNVSVYGGFRGNEQTLGDRPGINPVVDQPSNTILSGDIDEDGTLANNSYHLVVALESLTTTAVLDGFVITGGNADRITPRDQGGAIYNRSSSLIVTNCTVQSSSATFGGGIFNTSCSPTIVNCTFQNNIATFGAGVYNQNSSFTTLTNCRLQDNQAAIRGGGIFNTTSSPTLTNCILLNNTARLGGAISNERSSPTLTNCSLYNNSATEQGDVLYSVNDSNPILTNSVLFANGSSNTVTNIVRSSLTARYSLFDNTTGIDVSEPGNLTTTTSPFVSASSVELNACSPAINAGDNAAYQTANGPTTDLTGNPRFVGDRIDMGAVEFQQTPNFPIAITQHPVSRSAVCEGTAITASVSVTGTNPVYQWFKDGVSLGAAQSAATLSLSSVSGSDAGSYSVVVTGACNSVTSTTFSLTVNAISPDYQPLADLYNSTNGPAWAITTGWLTGCSPCSWFGVTCNGNGRVTQLRLTSNQLSGSLPASLSGLTSLQILVLNRNQLTGTLPASLSTLTALTRLDLSENQLNDSLPEGFGNLTNLQVVYFNSNLLTGTLPTSLTALNQLRIFQVDFNQITGSIPTNIGSLTALQTLNLSRNQLSGSIPASLGNLTGLQNLFLNNNQLSGCFPASLSALCGGGRSVLFSNNPGLPGQGNFSAFCTSQAGSDAFQPLASASPNPVCAGSLVSLSVSAGTFYRWSGPANFTATNQTPGFTPTTPANSGVYSVTVGNGSPTCTATATVNLTVSAPPSASLSVSGAISCAQTSVTLTASPVGEGTYTFSGPGINQSGAIATAIVSQTGTYSVVVSNANGCSATASVSVTADQGAPTVSISPSSATLTCASPSISLTAIGTGSLRWEDNSTDAIRTVSAPGTYSLVLTSANGCSAAATTTVQSATNAVNASLIASGTLTCANTSVTLTASPGGATTYAFTGPGLTQNGSTNTAIVSVTGAYSVVVTGANGCSALATTTVQSATAVPQLAITALPSTSVAQGQSVSLTASGAASYTWSTGANAPTINPPTSATGSVVYSVSGTTGNGCVGSAQITLTVSATAAPPAPSCGSPAGSIGQPLTLLEPIYNCQTGQFQFRTSGGNGSPITFAAIGITGPTTSCSAMVDAEVAFDIRNQRPNIQPFTLFATQGNITVTYSWNALRACAGSGGNGSPQVLQPVGPQSATVGVGYSLDLSGVFTDTETPGQLSLSVRGLPAGLQLVGSTILGTPTQAGPSSVTLTATDPGNLATSTTFSFSVSPAQSNTGVGGPLSATVVSYDCGSGAIVFGSTGGNGSGTPAGLVEYFAIGISGWTTNPNQTIEAGLRADPRPITLRVRQGGMEGQPFVFDFGAFCQGGGTTNTPPTVANPVGPQSATVGVAYSLNLGSVFTDAQTPAQLALSVSGLPAGLQLLGNTITGTPSASGVSQVTLRATDPGSLSASTTFTLTVLPAGSAPPVSGPLSATVVSYDCQTGAITFGSVGGNGSGTPAATVEYFAIGITGWTASPSQSIESGLRADPKPITLRVRQSGLEGQPFVFDFGAYCQQGARLASEARSELRVRVLGNPVQSEWAELVVDGLEGEALHIRVVSAQGRLVSQQVAEGTGPVRHQKVWVGSQAGVYLLQVHTPTRSRTVSIVRQ